MTRFRPTLQTLDDRITPASFAAKQEFSTGTNPHSVAVADFNGDGRADFATANALFSANTVSVLLNTTAMGEITPTFATYQSFVTDDRPHAVSATDFNGDGRVDIATANYSGTVSVLLNTTVTGATTPTFADHQDYFVSSNGLVSLAFGDFNGDGRSDIVTGVLGLNTISVLLNTTVAGATTPTFADHQDFATGGDPHSVAVADFNGDGRTDIAVANVSGTVSVLLNTTVAGASTPTFAGNQDFAVGGTPTAVAVADFNGDGRPDLAVANGAVAVLLNTTAAGATMSAFAEARGFSTPSNPSSVAVGDFNGDGQADIVATYSYQYPFLNSTSVAVLLNQTTAGAATPTFANRQTFATGNNPVSVAVEDFNGDGRPDIAVADNYRISVSVLSNTSTDFITTKPALTGQFGSTGVWGYNRTTNIWANLRNRNATALATAPNGNIVANFSGSGVWYYRASTGLWTQLNGNQASAVAIDALGNPIVSFPGYGTYRFSFPLNNFIRLGTTGATADKLAVSENGDVIANFFGYGVYRFRPQTDWQQINGYNATSLAVDPNGYVVANFTGFGVGQYIPYANGWRTVSSDDASAVAVDGYGNVFAAFSGYGIGRWSASTGSWTNLGPGAAATSLAADWFGNVFASVPGFGVSEFSQAFGWSPRRNVDASVLGLGR